MSYWLNIKEKISSSWQRIKAFKFSSLFDFSNWAQWSTPKELYLGIIPPIATLLTLTLVAGLIASGAWAWSALLTTAHLSFIPIFGAVAPIVLGGAFLNFWFHREITTFTLSARAVHENFEFSHKQNPTNLYRLVQEVTAAVNAHFKKKHGDSHRDIPAPRICTFTDHHWKLVTVEGRNPGKAAIFISSGALDFEHTGLTIDEFEALIANEIVKIYSRRGIGRTAVGVVSDLSETLNHLQEGNWLSKALFVLTMPLQLTLLLDKSIQRSYEYQAGCHLVDMGYGYDLIAGIDRLICPPLDRIGTARELKEAAKKYRREPYSGTSNVYKRFADWVDANEYPVDDNTGSRIISALDILAREGGFYVRELFSARPRATSLKNYLRPLISMKQDGQTYNLNTISEAQREPMRLVHCKKRVPLFQGVVRNSRLEPKPTAERQALKRQEAECERLEKRLDHVLNAFTEQQKQFEILAEKMNHMDALDPALPKGGDKNGETLLQQMQALQNRLNLLEGLSKSVEQPPGLSENRHTERQGAVPSPMTMNPH